MGLNCNWTSDDAITMKNDSFTMSSGSIIIDNKGFTSDSIIVNNGGITIDLARIQRRFRRHLNRYETIEKVIFNKPAVIIIFKDGTKEIAKCSENDDWDPEKGFVIALLKHYIHKSDLGWLMRKYVDPQLEKEQEEYLLNLPAMLAEINLPKTLSEITERLKQWADGYNVGEHDDRTWDEVAETKEE